MMASNEKVLCTAVSVVLLFSFLAGCRSAPSIENSPITVQSTVPSSSRIPPTVQRLAVFYPQTSMKELTDAYVQLAGATFQLKEQRPSLQIVERLDLQTLRDELRFQSSGLASDETAVRLGRVLGVDGILLYNIGCSLPRSRFISRNRYFSGFSGGSPLTVITSKIIMVETGEVVFHNVVTSRATDDDGGFSSFKGLSLRPMALDWGVDQTIADLRQAFQLTTTEEQLVQKNHGNKTSQ